MTGLLKVHCHIKGHLFTLGQVNSPKCDRWNQATETASHALCLLRFTHINIQVPRWTDILHNGVTANNSISRILYFVQGMGLLNAWMYGLHKIWGMVEVHVTNVPKILVFYSFPFCSYYDFYVYIQFCMTVFIITDTRKLWSVSWLQIRVLSFWLVSQWNV